MIRVIRSCTVSGTRGVIPSQHNNKLTDNSRKLLQGTVRVIFSVSFLKCCNQFHAYIEFFILSLYPGMQLVVFISQSENTVSEPKPDAEVSKSRGYFFVLIFVCICLREYQSALHSICV